MTDPRRRTPGHLMPVMVLAGAALAAAAPTALGQATRTWISGVGDDVNPCSRTAPCKTIAGAISKTAEGGEINAIDPGGYGAVTITKAITIDFAGTNGSILHSGTNGVIVNAGADDDVVLRNLSINGAGIGGVACPFASGTNGVRILQARSVVIEDTAIQNTTTTGIVVAPTGTGVAVTVNRVDLTGHCGTGINVAPTAGGTASVLVRDATVTRSGTGAAVGDGGRVWLERSTIFGNTTGLALTGTGRVDAYADTRIIGNTTDGAPTTVLGLPSPGATGPQGPAGPQGAAGLRGPRGLTGRVQLVTCTTVKGRKRCTTRLVNRPVRFRSLSAVRARLVSAERVVPLLAARAGSGALVFAPKAAIPAGRYTLRVTTRRGGVVTTLVRTVRVPAA